MHTTNIKHQAFYTLQTRRTLSLH